jgi:hypothetical protein
MLEMEEMEVVLGGIDSDDCLTTPPEGKYCGTEVPDEKCGTRMVYISCPEKGDTHTCCSNPSRYPGIFCVPKDEWCY